MRGSDQVDAFRSDADRCEKHGHPDNGRSDGIRFAMPVGMISIRGFDRQPQAPIDHGGANDIEKGFDAIGQQGERVPNQTRQAFGQRQEVVDRNAQQRGSDAPRHHLFRCWQTGHGCIVSYSRK